MCTHIVKDNIGSSVRHLELGKYYPKRCPRCRTTLANVAFSYRNFGRAPAGNSRIDPEFYFFRIRCQIQHRSQRQGKDTREQSLLMSSARSLIAKPQLKQVRLKRRERKGALLGKKSKGWDNWDNFISEYKQICRSWGPGPRSRGWQGGRRKEKGKKPKTLLGLKKKKIYKSISLKI